MRQWYESCEYLWNEYVISSYNIVYVNKVIAYGFNWNSLKFQQYELNMNNNHGVIKSLGLQIAPVAKLPGTKS